MELVHDALAKDSSPSDQANPENVSKWLRLVTQRAEELKGRVYEVLHKKYGQFTDAFQYGADRSQDVAAVATQLQRLTARVLEEEDGLEASLLAPAEERERVRKELDYVELVVCVLQTLTKLLQLFTAFDKKLDESDYSAAADVLGDMETCFGELPRKEEEGCDPRIFNSVKLRFLRCRNRLKTRMMELVARALVFEGSSLHVVTLASGVFGHVRLDKPVHLRDIMEGLRVLDLLDDHNKMFASRCLASLLEPLLSQPALHPKIRSVSDAQRRMGRPCILELVEKEQPPIAIQERLVTLFQDLTAVLEWLCKEPLFERGELIRSLGELVWPTLATGIMDRVLSQTIPDTPQGLEHYDTVVHIVEEFENGLVELGMLHEDQMLLCTYVHSVDHHYATRQRRKLLLQARTIIQSDDMNTSVVSVDTERGPAAFLAAAMEEKEAETELVHLRFPVCHVSVVAQQLMEFVYGVMDSTRGGSKESVVPLYRAAREVFDVWSAVRWQEEFGHVPQLAMLFHNDCMYLAHHLLTLGFQYRSDMPAPLNKTATFVDLVPRLRQMGEEAYGNQIQVQQQGLLDTLSNANGFREVGSTVHFPRTEKAVLGCLHQLRKLAKVWHVLPAALMESALAELSDAVLERVVQDVLTLEDIHTQDSVQLSYLLHTLLKGCHQLMNTIGKKKEQSDPKIMVESKSLQQAPRVKTILQILDVESSAKLANEIPAIREHLSSDEIRHLLVACFKDSEGRKECMSRL